MWIINFSNKHADCEKVFNVVFRSTFIRAKWDRTHYFTKSMYIVVWFKDFQSEVKVM